MTARDDASWHDDEEIGAAVPTDAVDDDDDDEPLFQLPFALEAVPGFCERLLEHIMAGEEAEEYVFEGVEIESAQGVQLVPIGAYDPSKDDALHSGVTDPALPSGGLAEVAEAWTQGVRRVLREAWGEPLVRSPRLVGVEQEPEGLLDYLLLSVAAEEAELWDRGALCCALVTSWEGEPRRSMLRQVLLVLPRALAFGGMSELVTEEHTALPELMLGEHPLELRRRAWIMSTLFDRGETRVLGTALGATRYSLRDRNGATTIWNFTDDGRILLLVQDPEGGFATEAPQQFLRDQIPELAERAGAASVRAEDAELRAAESEALMILVARLLDGVPSSLAELVAAPAVDSASNPLESALEFRTLGGRSLPVISGVAWFDGAVWHVPAQMLEIGHQGGFGIDDFGFHAALRRPYRLGGAFGADVVVAPDDEERRAAVEQLIASCPYPAQERPQGAVRLGSGVPSSKELPEVVEQIERACDAWWETAPSSVEWNDRTFRIAGRDLSDSDPRALDVVLAAADSWNADALHEWWNALYEVMSQRWGQALEYLAEDRRHGLGVRAPLARVLRAIDERAAPMWWVNGHAVMLVEGRTGEDAPYDSQVILAIAKPDAMLDLASGTSLWEVRHRARVLAAVQAEASRHALSDSAEHTGDAARVADVPSGPETIAWDGPALAGSTLVPEATRGRFRAGEHWWVWHFTHDGRGLLFSAPVNPGSEGSGAEAAGSESTGAEAAGRPSFEDHAERFAGVPDDLLSLVADRDPAGLFEVVRRTTAPAGTTALDRASTLPVAHAVFWRDDLDWRASEGMLRAVRAVTRAAAAGTGLSTESPLPTLYHRDLGAPQMQWALQLGYTFGPALLAAPNAASFIFDRLIEPEWVEDAVRALGSVHELPLTGSLNALLDVIIDTPGSRYLLDAALSNLDPRHRREIVLWLLEQDVDASIALSFLTPLNVLFANPTLSGADAVLVRRLLASGATPHAGVLAAAYGTHPLVQLAARDLDEDELEPLVDALFERAAYDVAAPILPDGRSLLSAVEAGFAHGRSRSRLVERLRSAAVSVQERR